MAHDFNQFITSHGYTAPPGIQHGVIQKIPALGKRQSNTSARVKLFADGQGGWLFDWTTGQFEVWQAQRQTLSRQQQADLQAERNRLKAEREAEQNAAYAQAAKAALAIWDDNMLCGSHPYLARKRIKPHGVKSDWHRTLLLPLYDESHTLASLQFIEPDGTKRFLTGGKTKGCHWWITGKTDTLLIAEGFATAASLYEVTGQCAVIAYSAGNLRPVAKIVRKDYPSADIIVMGDNDVSGTGQKAAREAALAVGGKFMIPPTGGHDWNDHINSTGGTL